MKKKFLTFALMICFILPCAILISACGGNKEVSAIQILYGDQQSTQINVQETIYYGDELPTDFQTMKIYVVYKNGDKEEVSISNAEVRGEWTKDGFNQNFSLTQNNDAGFWVLTVTYKGFSATLSLTILPTEASDYTINLSNNTTSWSYGENEPAIVVNHPDGQINLNFQNGQYTNWDYDNLIVKLYNAVELENNYPFNGSDEEKETYLNDNGNDFNAYSSDFKPNTDYYIAVKIGSTQNFGASWSAPLKIKTTKGKIYTLQVPVLDVENSKLDLYQAFKSVGDSTVGEVFVFQNDNLSFRDTYQKEVQAVWRWQAPNATVNSNSNTQSRLVKAVATGTDAGNYYDLERDGSNQPFSVETPMLNKGTITILNDSFDGNGGLVATTKRYNNQPLNIYVWELDASTPQDFDILNFVKVSKSVDGGVSWNEITPINTSNSSYNVEVLQDASAIDVGIYQYKIELKSDAIANFEFDFVGAGSANASYEILAKQRHTESSADFYFGVNGNTTLEPDGTVVVNIDLDYDSVDSFDADSVELELLAKGAESPAGTEYATTVNCSISYIRTEAYGDVARVYIDVALLEWAYGDPGVIIYARIKANGKNGWEDLDRWLQIKRINKWQVADDLIELPDGFDGDKTWEEQLAPLPDQSDESWKYGTWKIQYSYENPYDRDEVWQNDLTQKPDLTTSCWVRYHFVPNSFAANEYSYQMSRLI